MSLSYNKKNIVLARNLRKDATAQERHLWYDFLADYPVRFQRQKAIGEYIADFYCHRAKLVIELDGSQHSTEHGRREDAYRTETLAGYGLSVIRFENRQVDEDFARVCRYIDAAVKAALAEDDGV